MTKDAGKGIGMRLVLATANPDKAAELRAILEEELDGPIELITRPQGVAAVEETGESLEENARLKAVALVAATGEAAVADDTGLEVAALGGARACGPPLCRRGRQVLRQRGKAAHRPRRERDRRARFRTVVVCRFPDGAEIIGEGVVEGEILQAPRGLMGFGYDPVFAPEGAGGRTFAEMSPAEKPSCRTGVLPCALSLRAFKGNQSRRASLRAGLAKPLGRLCRSRRHRIDPARTALVSLESPSRRSGTLGWCQCTRARATASTTWPTMCSAHESASSSIETARQLPWSCRPVNWRGSSTRSISCPSPRPCAASSRRRQRFKTGTSTWARSWRRSTQMRALCVRAVTGGVSLTPAARSANNRWGLVASEQARKALDELQFHVADAARRFIFGQLLEDPVGSGVELHGFLIRRLAVRVETALVIYRLDSVKRVVRLVEVLNIGGMVGRHDSHQW